MPIVACPACGEDEELTGERGDERTLLRCDACGHRWDRDLRPTCQLCGSDDLEVVPTSTLEEAGRGQQRTPSGIRDLHVCWNCGARDATSADPAPAPPDWREQRGAFDINWRQ